MKLSSVFRPLLLAVCVFSLSMCSPGQSNSVRKLSELEKNPGNPDATTLAELKRSVAKYEKIVNQKIRDTGQLGVYYKLLTIKYMESQMYGPARETLGQALTIYPENPNLFNLGGIIAAHLAKAQTGEKARETFFLEAERFYRRAIELDPTYEEALYGLAILYDFELGSPLKAEPLLVKLLQKAPSNSDAQFLLARVFVETGRVTEAVALYDRIARSSAPESARVKAEENKRALTEGRNGK